MSVTLPSISAQKRIMQQRLFELLRGLVTHAKLGPNNHSSEDDLWKSRGQELAPGDRKRIIKNLLKEGILNRKRNDSLGGKGWVYWVGDVPKAYAVYPELDPWLGVQTSDKG